MAGITLWLIDDEKEIFSALSIGLRPFKQIERIQWFSDCRSALQLLRTIGKALHPDVILLDIFLPDIKGIKAIPMIQKAAPASKIIMLTGDGRSVSVVQSAQLGANGYLLKPFRAADVVRACEEALEGGMPMTASVVPHLIQRLPGRTRGADHYHLTPGERQVLPYITKGNKDREIAEKLSVSYHTVRTHVRNIHRKLRTDTRAELAAKILREGLLT